MRRFAVGIGVVAALGVALAFDSGVRSRSHRSLGVVAALGVALASACWPAFEAVLCLAFGWVAYSMRVLPRVTIAWDGVATGVVCLVLFAIGLHRTLGWLTREVRSARGAPVDASRAWSARWTASIYR